RRCSGGAGVPRGRAPDGRDGRADRGALQGPRHDGPRLRAGPRPGSRRAMGRDRRRLAATGDRGARAVIPHRRLRALPRSRRRRGAQSMAALRRSAGDAEPAASGRICRRGIRDRVSRGGRLCQAGRGGQRRRRARCRAPWRDGAARRPAGPARSRRGDRRAAARSRARAAARRGWARVGRTARVAARRRAGGGIAARAARPRMKVLYISHTAVVSGAERSLIDLLDALGPSVEPLLATPDGRLQELAREHRVATTPLTGTAGSLRLHPLHTPRALAELALAARQVRRTLARCDAQLVHANSIRAGLVLALARWRATPTVVHVRDCLPRGAVSDATLRLLAATATTVVANSRYTAESLLAV